MDDENSGGSLTDWISTLGETAGSVYQSVRGNRPAPVAAPTPLQQQNFLPYIIAGAALLVVVMIVALVGGRK